MKPSARALTISILGSLSLGSPALAQVWYVDAVHGSDSNSGLHRDDAWRTITHANQSMPEDAKLYVLPGTYDAALGEVFPLRPPHGTDLVGLGTGVRPVIDGTGVSAWLISVSNTAASSRGIDLVGGTGGIGVGAYGEFENAGFTLRDAEVRNVAGWALAVGANESNYASASCYDVSFVGNEGAIRVWGDYGAGAGASATDCVFTGHTQTMFEAWDGGLGLYRCRVVDNGSRVVYAHANSDITVEDSLIARNNGYALDVRNTTDATILRSTIADNVVGIGSGGGGPCYCDSELTESIFFNTGSDLTVGNFTVTSCDIGDGDFAGSNGNIAADPLFVDPLAGDYRLRFGSPCIDAVTGGSSAGVHDMNGIVRHVDGDLDTIEKSDMGAYEFAPLFRRNEAHAGQTLEIELWGADSLSTELWGARGPLVLPVDTPYGQYELDAALRLGTHPVASGPPTVLQITLPPSFAGRTFSLQSLTDSLIAPLGAAWTNAIQFVVLP